MHKEETTMTTHNTPDKQGEALEPCPFCPSVPSKTGSGVWWFIRHERECLIAIIAQRDQYIRPDHFAIWNTRRASVATVEGDAVSERKAVIGLIERFQREPHRSAGTINALEWLRRQIVEGNHAYHKFEPPTVGFAKSDECSRCGMPGNALMHLLSDTAASSSAPAERFVVHEPTGIVECNDSACPLGSTIIGWPHTFGDGCMYAATVLRAAELPAGPRCPKCGYVMCQQFDSRPVNALADIVTPNGTYICYHCTPLQPTGEQGSKRT